MAHLALSFLGGFHVMLEGHPVTEFKSNKVRALLAYLAVEAHRPQRREVLAGLLWPDRTNHDALSNLRYSLASLRGTLDERSAPIPSLLIAHDTIQFNRAGDTWLDVAEFERLIANTHRRALANADVDALRAAVSLYRGGFLEGFTVSDAAPFEEWMVVRREHTAQQMIHALGRLVAEYEARGEYREAQACARQQVALEPWDEAAQRALMRTLALDGQRPAALHQFQVFQQILQKELGVEPVEETVALYEAIRAGRLAEETGRKQGYKEEKGQGVRKASASLKAGAYEVAAQRPGAKTAGTGWQGDRQAARPVEAGVDVTTNAALASGSSSPGSYLPPVVAREYQLAQLQRGLVQALAGAGRVLFLTGEAGSGKTALLNEFTRQAMQAHPELLVAAGTCNAAAGMGDPYLPFREILQLLTGDIEAKRAGATLAPEHARRLWAAIPDALQALKEHGPGLIDTFVAGADLALRVEAFARQPGRPALQGQRHQAVRAPASLAADLRQAVQQSDIFDQVTHVLQALARRHPLCLVLDDLQWADSGSLSLLFHLGRRITTSRVLVVVAYRPDAVASQAETTRHSLELIVNELQRLSGQESIDLDACDGRQFVAALLHTEPNRLQPGFAELLFRHTEGHPLFTVELLRRMEERGDLVRDEAGLWIEGPELHWEKLPVRVEATIAERIGRVPDRCRTLLAAASVEGDEFTAEAVASALGIDERAVVQCLSAELGDQHYLVTAASLRRLGTRRLSRYRFRHHLFQQYLYNHIDAVRRAHLHEAIGNSLERLHEEASDELNALAPSLAWHFEQAGLAERAAGYHLRAGSQAVRLFAYEEAIAHLTQGLTLLDALPETPERTRLKLDLHLAAAYPFSMARGFWAPERIQALERAHQLSQHPALSGKRERLEVLAARAYFANFSAQTALALEIGEQVLRLAEHDQDQEYILLAHSLLGFTLAMRVDLAQARDHLDKALAGYERRTMDQPNPVLGIHVDVMSLSLQAAALWLLGYPDQASRRMEEALATARDSNHAGTLGFAQSAGSLLLFLLGRDPVAARQQVEALRQVSERGLPLAAWAGSLSNWGPGGDGQVDTVLQHMQRRDETFRAVGTGIGSAGQYMVLAQGYALAGQTKAGLDTLDEALAWIDGSGVFYLQAEVLRLRGELLLKEQHLQEETVRTAEDCYREAIATARRQGARWWELRATISLCRLLKQPGVGQAERLAEARQMLAAIYGWFDEGFTTRDMQEARALLDELDGRHS